MCVDCCLLFVDLFFCCVLFGIFGACLGVACCSFVIAGLLFLLFVVRCLSPGARCVLFVGCLLLFVVRLSLFVDYCLLYVV